MSEWTEDQRGNVLGHNLSRGTYLLHIVELRDAGPGAIRFRTVCNGMQPWILVDSGKTEAEWEQWKKDRPRFIDWPHIAVIDPRQKVCGKCCARYTQRRERVRSRAITVE